MKSLNFIFATAIAAAAAAVMTSGANALVILTLDNDGTPSYQQTQNNPCVIGNPSCNNPAGFGFNDINGDDNDTTADRAADTSKEASRKADGEEDLTDKIGNASDDVRRTMDDPR